MPRKSSLRWGVSNIFVQQISSRWRKPSRTFPVYYIKIWLAMSMERGNLGRDGLETRWKLGAGPRWERATVWFLLRRNPPSTFRNEWPDKESMFRSFCIIPKRWKIFWVRHYCFDENQRFVRVDGYRLEWRELSPAEKCEFVTSKKALLNRWGCWKKYGVK